MANIPLAPQPDFAAMAASYQSMATSSQSLATEIARIPNTPQFTAGNAILDQLRQITTAVREVNTVVREVNTKLDTAVQEINMRLDTMNTVKQAGGAAAKHSTRRTTSVKKCVNSI
jgi:hypothetical protein